MIEQVEVPQGRRRKTMWPQYCGFLDLSIDEFMDIQNQLLSEQLERIHGSSIIREIMPELPESPSAFRAEVPLTDYEDYADELRRKSESGLPVSPFTWAMTSGRSGVPKWVPYTEQFIEALAQTSVAVVILACADRYGDVNLRRNFRVLLNLPSPPYMTGILNELLSPKLGARVIPPPDRYRDADFETKIREGFRIALQSGVDLLSSMTSVLIRMGERFVEQSESIELRKILLKPRILARFARAYLRSKWFRRPVLPKDLWPLKGLACYGMDTSIYRRQLEYYWGKQPFESYGATETGVLAVSSWTKQYLTFLPGSAYLEFLPVDGTAGDTVTLADVRPGERYEPVVTSFHGLPFLRYRMGDVVRFVSLRDEDAGVSLPQAVFEGRIDGIIDLAGFTRIDERIITQALFDSGVKFADWTARKEEADGRPVLRIYLEPAADAGTVERRGIEELIHTKLAAIHREYADLEQMLGFRPLRVALVRKGAFQHYYEVKKREGLNLAHLKPPHMNPTDSMIEELLQR